MTQGQQRRPRVLVIDDNHELLSLVTRALQRRGYETMSADDGASALKACSRQIPDVILLDLQLPDIDGMDLCYEMRDTVGVPIIMLTSRDSVQDRVEGLRAGADDYVVKPFAMEELVARIEAVLRRMPAAPSILEYEDLAIDLYGRTVTRDGEPVHLTPKEFVMLELLARRPRRVLTRETLKAAFWPGDRDIDDNLLDAHVTNLRQKLEAGGRSRLVQTVRGVGFVLR